VNNERLHPIFRNILSGLNVTRDIMRRTRDMNHWSNRKWVVVENGPEDVVELSIWTDGESFKPVLVICEGTTPTPEDRALAAYVVTLQNNKIEKENPSVANPRW